MVFPLSLSLSLIPFFPFVLWLFHVLPLLLFVWLFISYIPSVCQFASGGDAGKRGVWGGIGEYETFCFAFRRQGKPELLSQTLALTLKIFEVDT